MTQGIVQFKQSTPKVSRRPFKETFFRFCFSEQKMRFEYTLLKWRILI